MSDETNRLELYKIALEQVRFEGQLLWQIFGAFLLAHTIFMAFLLQAALGNGQAITGYRLGVFIASFAGFCLSIPWSASYSRSSAYYIFRMAQAREAEPKDWNLLTNNGVQFSAGNIVKVGSKMYRIGWLARILRTQYSVPLLIGFFYFAYVAIFILSGPWWQQ